MKIRAISENILGAVVALLAPSCPDLTPTALVSALRTYEPEAPAPAAPMLTKHDAARLLRVTHYTIVRMLKEGTLPGVKIRGQWRVPAEAVRKLAEPETASRA